MGFMGFIAGWFLLVIFFYRFHGIRSYLKKFGGQLLVTRNVSSDGNPGWLMMSWRTIPPNILGMIPRSILSWLVVWLSSIWHFPINIGNGIIIPIDSYFSEGWPNHQPVMFIVIPSHRWTRLDPYSFNGGLLFHL